MLRPASALARNRLAVALAGVAVLGAGVLLAPRLLRERPREAATPQVQPGTRVQAPAQAAPAALLQPGPLADNRPLGPLSGVLLDGATGEPVTAFAMWTLPGPPPSDESGWQAASRFPTSAPGGEWGVPFLADGTYTLRFSAPGFEDTILENVAIPSRLGHLEVRLEHGPWVHGTLRDARGKPVPDFALRLVPEQGFGSGPTATPLEALTDAAGVYSFSGVPPGRWQAVLAGLEGVVREPVASETWTLEENAEAVWDVALPELTSVRLAVEWQSKRFVFARLEAALTSSWGGRVVASFHNDAALFERVQPGLHELTVGKPGESPWYREQVEVPASATPVEWKRSITPPEREKPALDTRNPGLDAQKPGRKKGGGGRRAAAETAVTEPVAGGQAATKPGTARANGQQGSPNAQQKPKRKKKDG